MDNRNKRSSIKGDIKEKEVHNITYLSSFKFSWVVFGIFSVVVALLLLLVPILSLFQLRYM